MGAHTAATQTAPAPRSAHLINACVGGFVISQLLYLAAAVTRRSVPCLATMTQPHPPPTLPCPNLEKVVQKAEDDGLIDGQSARTIAMFGKIGSIGRNICPPSSLFLRLRLNVAGVLGVQRLWV